MNKHSQRNIQSLHNPSHRMNFTIISYTSKQKSYQPKQLQLQSPQSKGWQSQRFCTYPQMITIQLIDLGIIEKLTFLSHQSKITTKIDIQSRQSMSEQWKKLGYTCMQSNMTTNYQARQLRTVKVNKDIAKYLRFTLHANYINTANVFNQVGLIAISVYGQRYHPKPLDEMKQRGVLPPGAVLDKETLDKLRQLQYMKRQAIDSNDFDKASQIKQQIQKLKNGVQALAILQKQKKDAIRKQDYQQAKKIFQKMKRIRGPLPRQVVSSNDRYDHINSNNNNNNNNNNNKSTLSNSRNNHNTFTPIVNRQNKSISFDVNMMNDNDNKNDTPSSPILGLIKKNNNNNNNNNNKKRLQQNRSQLIDFDEVKVGVKQQNKNNKNKKNPFEAEQLQYKLQHKQQLADNNSISSPITQKKINKNNKPQQTSKFNRNRLPYQQQQINTNNNQNQTQQQQQQLPAQCHQYYTVIPQHIFKHIFSQNKINKQHALDQLINLVDKIDQQDYLQRIFINAVIFIISHTIDDKIITVVIKSIELLGSMFKQYKPKPQQIQRQNITYLKHILQQLSQHLGHANDKLKQQAQDVYIVLPKFSKLTSKQLCIQTITLNQNIDRLPRIIISKLSMLGRLIMKYNNDQNGLNNLQKGEKDKNNKKQIVNKEKYQDVIEYSKRFLQDRNSQVRSTAVKLLVFIGKIVGYKELIDLLGNVKENTLKIIQDKLQENQQNNLLNNQHTNSLKQQNPQKINNSLLMSPKKSPPQTIKKSLQKDNSIKQSPKVQTNKKSLPTTENNKNKKNNQKQPQKQKQAQYQPNNPQYTCQYCQKFDKRLQNENYRDVHWFKQCVMITICKQCQQAVQVQSLNAHLLQQCQRKKYYKKCPRCKQAVLAKDYTSHVEKKSCIPSKPMNVASRCPHCHQDIQPKKRGWLKHLIQQGCPCQNDRVRQQ